MTNTRILIVEDELEQRKGLATLLRHDLPNCKIYTAGNAKEALNKFQKYSINILILDMNLGIGLTGLDIFETLIGRNHNFITIALTSYGHQYGYIAGRLGIEYYFNKPLHKKRYLNLLQTINDNINQMITSKSSKQVIGKKTELKLLFLAANPTNTTKLRLDEEIRGIDSALRKSKIGDRFKITQHWAVRLDDLQEVLLRHKPTIVHFSGHGSNTSELVFEDNDGLAVPLSKDAIGRLFEILKDNIKCIVLNACYSFNQAKEIAKNIDCVIGMSNSIDDKSAISFSAAFYQALAYEKDLQTAFDLGCLMIELKKLGGENIPRLITFNIPANKIFL